MACGDDWIRCFTCEDEMRRAWTIWRDWATAHGMKLGVKKKLKTVVTGVRFVDGQAHDILDPKLETEEGKLVPTMTRDEAYKHLGLMLRADSEWADNWRQVQRRVGEAMAKLGRLRRAKMGEFELIGDVLMGGLVSFYSVGSYITRDEAEELEKVYRRRHREKFGIPPGTACAQYYDSGIRCATDSCSEAKEPCKGSAGSTAVSTAMRRRGRLKGALHESCTACGGWRKRSPSWPWKTLGRRGGSRRRCGGGEDGGRCGWQPRRRWPRGRCAMRPRPGG